MYELKTKQSNDSVYDFINSLENSKKKNDSLIILEIMKEITKEEPKMWGKSMIGFGVNKYQYGSGHKGEFFKIGFSPRKQSITIYLTYGLEDQEELLNKLGKHKIGKGCLYINKIDDVNTNVLKELIQLFYEKMS